MLAYCFLSTHGVARACPSCVSLHALVTQCPRGLGPGSDRVRDAELASRTAAGALVVTAANLPIAGPHYCIGSVLATFSFSRNE
jgi:hypothetical protein